ncbi:MAG: 30S ribosome-binding factor RbfA [Dehalococcoidia bacterium]
MYDRIDGVNSLLKREISGVISSEVKDHRLAEVVSVVSVTTSRNLQNATAYVTVYGDAKAKKDTIAGLNSASKFIQRKLRKNLDIKHIPSIRFVLDESLDEADKIMNIMDSISKDPLKDEKNP